MNIWLVSIYEQTPIDNVFSTRFLSIANEALSRGHNVTFFASTFKHNIKKQRFSNTHVQHITKNYTLVCVKSKSYKRNISFSRLISHYLFASSAKTEMEKYTKPDVILMAYPPVTLAKVVSSWAKKNGIPVVLDIVDPWPDTFKILVPDFFKPLLSILLLPMRISLQKILKNVSGVTAISNQYIKWICEYYPLIPIKKVFYPAADFDLLKNSDLIKEANLNNKTFTIIYAGSLALSYDIDCILSAAEILEKINNNIKFLIAGAGHQEKKIKEYEKNHTNLKFLGRLNKIELLRAYSNSDLGCIQHIKGATQSVTYKLFDLLSCGLPILNSLESEMKDLILNNKVGLHNSPGNSQQLAENILTFYRDRKKLKLYIENGYSLTRAKGDSKKVYGEFVDLIESLNKSREDINS